jgi:hypothetical protein
MLQAPSDALETVGSGRIQGRIFCDRPNCTTTHSPPIGTTSFYALDAECNAGDASEATANHFLFFTFFDSRCLLEQADSNARPIAARASLILHRSTSVATERGPLLVKVTLAGHITDCFAMGQI